MVHDAYRASTFQKSASALSLLERDPDRVIDVPEPGCLVVWCHDARNHLGHAGDRRGLPGWRGVTGYRSWA
jgi:hypothetical protein